MAESTGIGAGTGAGAPLRDTAALGSELEPAPWSDGDRPASAKRPPRESAATASGRQRSQALQGGFAIAESLAMAVGMLWVVGQLENQWAEELTRPSAIPGVSVQGSDVGGLHGKALDAVASGAALASLDRPLTLVAGEAEVVTTARALGAAPVWEQAAATARVVGRSGAPLVDLATRLRAGSEGIDLQIGYRFVEERALAHVHSITPLVERPSLPTRLDLENRKVVLARRGAALLAYDSMSAIATGLASGADRIELVLQPKPPVDDPLGPIAEELDVSMVLGSFDTPYRMDATQNDRIHNLKVGAASIDGHVLMPDDTFSFNDTVGDRSAHSGYRYATGIAAGQLVDVLGGGICQVSSTVFGAGFFAGLEVVSARPHSRPSSYVDMGLDSTVVWPSIDMKLKNSYDFPVVLHMTVSQGKVRTEVLGPRRPYQVAFERKLEEVIPYKSVWREDDRLRAGTQSTAQWGMRGFKLTRTRKLIQGGEVVKTEDWELNYPSTTEILRRGNNPVGEVPETKKRPNRRDPDPVLKIMQ